MFWTVVLIILGVLIAGLLLLGIIAIIKKPGSVYKHQPEQQNPMEGKKVVFVEDDNDKENADGVKGRFRAAHHHSPRSGPCSLRRCDRSEHDDRSFYAAFRHVPVYFLFHLRRKAFRCLQRNPAHVPGHDRCSAYYDVCSRLCHMVPASLRFLKLKNITFLSVFYFA